MYAYLSAIYGDGMDEHSRQLAQKFKRMERAYTQLAEGAHMLLQLETVYWTEALLLKTVHRLYRRRLQQIRGIIAHLPDESDD